MNEAISQSQPFFSACPLCAETNATAFSNRGGFAFSRCPKCTLTYKTQSPKDADSAYYDREYTSGHEGHRRVRFEHRVGKAQRQIRAGLRFQPNAKSVIDIGCSYGYAVEAGKRLGLRSMGVDVSQHVVKQCVERGLEARVGNTDQIPASDGEFDIVLMKHVLEHSSSPATALSEVRRVLSPNGVVVIAVPDVEYIKATMSGPDHKYYAPDHHGREHHVYYSQQTLAQMLERHGFKVQTHSKIVRLASRHLGDTLLEPFRLAMVASWQTVAQLTHLRRELFFVAQRSVH